MTGDLQGILIRRLARACLMETVLGAPTVADSRTIGPDVMPGAAPSTPAVPLVAWARTCRRRRRLLRPRGRSGPRPALSELTTRPTALRSAEPQRCPAAYHRARSRSRSRTPTRYRERWGRPPPRARRPIHRHGGAPRLGDSHLAQLGLTGSPAAALPASRPPWPAAAPG